MDRNRSFYSDPWKCFGGFSKSRNKNIGVIRCRREIQMWIYWAWTEGFRL